MRKLKTLGLALVAVLAMSAMGAASAQAEEEADFWAAESATLIDAENDSELHPIHSFVVGGQELTCTEVSGTASPPEGNEGPTLTSTNIQYENCHVVTFGITFPVTVDMNSCGYVFTADTYSEPESDPDGIAEGSAKVECEDEGDEITVTIFNTGSPHGSLRCTVHVPPQDVNGTIIYRNTTTEGKMAVTVETSGVSVTATKTDGDTLGCNEHVHDPESEYEGAFWAKATDSKGNYVDTTVTGTTGE